MAPKTSFLAKHPYAFTTVTKIEAGPEKVWLYIHSFLLTGSPLEKALVEDPNDPFEECQAHHMIRLPEDSPKVVENYIHWLYTGRDGHEQIGLKDGYMLLFQTHVLAHRLEDWKTANKIMNWIVLLRSEENVLPSLDVVQYVFGPTVTNLGLSGTKGVDSPLSMFVVECYGPNASSEDFAALGREDLPNRFLQYVITYLRPFTKGSRRPWTSTRSELERHHIFPGDRST